MGFSSSAINKDSDASGLRRRGGGEAGRGPRARDRRAAEAREDFNRSVGKLVEFPDLGGQSMAGAGGPNSEPQKRRFLVVLN